MESNHFEREVIHKLNVLQETVNIALVNIAKLQQGMDALLAQNKIVGIEAKHGDPSVQPASPTVP